MSDLRRKLQDELQQSEAKVLVWWNALTEAEKELPENKRKRFRAPYSHACADGGLQAFVGDHTLSPEGAAIVATLSKTCRKCGGCCKAFTTKYPQDNWDTETFLPEYPKMRDFARKYILWHPVIMQQVGAYYTCSAHKGHCTVHASRPPMCASYYCKDVFRGHAQQYKGSCWHQIKWLAGKIAAPMPFAEAEQLFQAAKDNGAECDRIPISIRTHYQTGDIWMCKLPDQLVKACEIGAYSGYYPMTNAQRREMRSALMHNGRYHEKVKLRDLWNFATKFRKERPFNVRKLLHVSEREAGDPEKGLQVDPGEVAEVKGAQLGD